jgi:hypothetical protein
MDPPELVTGIATRRSNKEAHPGAIAKPRPYSYQSSAAKRAKLLAKANTAEVLADIHGRKLAVVASLENKMADEDKQMDIDAAHPPQKTCSNWLKLDQSKNSSSEGDSQTHVALMLLQRACDSFRGSSFVHGP